MIMIAVAFLLGLILCLLFGVPYIDWLKKKMIGQYIKDVAPEAHAKKQGTPTTGGVFIITAAILASIVTLMMAQRLTTSAFIILITFLFYTLAGFQDDYIKIKGKGNDGLSPKGKLFRQIAIALLPAMYVMMNYTNGSTINFGHYVLDLKWLYPFFAVFVITGASNAYNLTDGLDGLAGGTSAVFFLALGSLITLQGGSGMLVLLSCCLAGALAAYLVFNTGRASLFMGDTGSLSLGGFAACVALFSGNALVVPLAGLMFVLSSISVILQVIYYKKTGKRIFLMAPLHHHFQHKGHSEGKISYAYAAVTAVISATLLIPFV